MFTQIKPCPKCKESVGWYEHMRKFYQQFFTKDGHSDFATDGTSCTGTRKYCYNCRKDITGCIAESNK